MEEQKTEKAEEVAKPASEALNLIEQAKLQADRMEAQNQKYEELVKRQEEANSIAMLSGHAAAGQPQISEADKTKLDTMQYFKGTEIERALRNVKP